LLSKPNLEAGKPTDAIVNVLKSRTSVPYQGQFFTGWPEGKLIKECAGFLKTVVSAILAMYDGLNAC